MHIDQVPDRETPNNHPEAIDAKGALRKNIRNPRVYSGREREQIYVDLMKN